jgi:hypothetical protein
MSDIVQKLRLVDSNQVLLAPPPHDTSYLQVGLLCHEAANEIERLRAEVLAEREACVLELERNADKTLEEIVGIIHSRGEVKL